MPKLITPWTDIRTADLKRYYEEGYSCSQIAGLLGYTTRNAVIGKVHRLGLAGRGAGKLPVMATRSGSARRSSPRPIKPPLSDKFSPQETEVLRSCTVDPRHIDLLDLEPKDCRWPFGDSPFTHCGHPQLGGSSYCAAHFVLSIGPGTTSEQYASKVSEKQIGARA